MAMDIGTSWAYEVTENPVAPLRFGISARVRNGGEWVTVAEEPAFSENRSDTQALADLYTASQLSPVHLSDEVMNYLTEKELELEKKI